MYVKNMNNCFSRSITSKIESSDASCKLVGRNYMILQAMFEQLIWRNGFLFKSSPGKFES